MLLGMLESEYSEAVTSATVQLVRNFGGEAVPQLIAALEELNRSGETYGSYEAIVTALGMIGDSRAVPILVTAMEGNHERSLILEALAKIGGSDALSGVMDFYLKGTRGSENDFWVGIFGRFGEEAQADLVRAFARTKPAARLPATPPTMQYNRLFYIRGSVRVHLVALLRRLKGAEAAPVMRKALKDPEADVRAQAADELGDLKDPDAVPLLMKALGDQEFPVIVASIGALGRIGEEKALPPLIELLEPDLGKRGGDSYVRKAAEEAILSFGEEALPALTSALEGSNKTKRKHLAGLIAQLGND